MIVVVMASQKGGSGKTTLCGHLAVEAEKNGAGPVALIDSDPQGSLSQWWNARRAKSPVFAKVGVLELEDALEELRDAGMKLAFIDTPPAITESISRVIAHADLVIVPTRPSPHDLRAVGATVDMAERCGKPLIFVVNAATARARITGEAAVALSQHGVVAPVTLHHRVDFAASMVDGRTVGEVVPKSASARETRELWIYVQDRLARLTRDPALFPEFRPAHFPVSPLSRLDEPEAAAASIPDIEQAGFPEIPLDLEANEAPPSRQAAQAPLMREGEEAGSQPVDMPSASYTGPERRRAKEWREGPETLFNGPERRAGVFGRRQAETVDAGLRK